MRSQKIILIASFFLLSIAVFPQPKSNLDIIYNLVEENANQIINQLPQGINSVNFEYSSLPEYENLKNRFIYYLDNSDLLNKTDNKVPILKYSLDQIGILYSEPFRESLLGDYKVERKIFLNGTFALGNDNRVIKSNMVSSSRKDTIYYSEIKDIESQELKITQGTKPPDPLFESLLEPIIAVSAVVVTIILLFTVRSK